MPKFRATPSQFGTFPDVKKKETQISFFSGEMSGKLETTYLERPGAWYFPPLASLITSGGRLLLAMLEKSVLEKQGSYLFCDTDSLCIVGSERGGLVPCLGGEHSLKRRPAIKALSLADVKSIAKKFSRLNPYDPSLVPEILKIEDVNFIDGDPKRPFRQLFGFAISAKRYALYLKSRNELQIKKASGHGLGYLFSPKERKKDEEIFDENTPQWVVEAWDFLLGKELGLRSNKPSWLDLPAMMRMVVTTPNVLKDKRPDWLGPFNFFLFPLVSERGGYPKGFDRSTFLFITPMESDRRKWKTMEGINLYDGLSYEISMVPTLKQDKVIPESFKIILNQYLRKPEVKSLGPDGNPCIGTTQGLLGRTRIVAGRLIPVAKETDRRWVHGEDPSMLDFEVGQYQRKGKMVVADHSDRRRWRRTGVRNGMRRSGLSQKAVSAILNGEPVRIVTLAAFRHAMDV